MSTILYTPTALEKSLKDVFLKAALGALSGPDLVNMLCEQVPSTARSEKYLWLGEAPQMAAFENEIKLTPISESSYTITNNRYSAAIGVKRDDIADDQLGQVMARIRQLAIVGARHPIKLTIEALINGTSTTGYDSNNFFSATHPSRGAGSGSGAQANLLSQTGTTTANIQTDVRLALAAMNNFKAENGEPYHEMGVQQLAMLVPPAIEGVANEAVYGALISNTSNVGARRYSIEVIPVPRLTAGSASHWYLLNVAGPTKPLIFQMREGLQFNALENGSDTEFTKKVYQYEAAGRWNVGYGAWQNAIKIGS